MGKKNLLNESAVRRFMKLANLDTVGSRTLSEMREEEVEEGMRGMPGMRDEDPGMRDSMMEEEEDEGAELDFGLDADKADTDSDVAPDAAGSDELELDVTPERAQAAKEAAELLMQIADAAMGGADMDMGDESPDMDMDMDVGDASLDTDLDSKADVGEMGNDDDEDLEPLDEIEIIDEKALVSEVTRRVSERLRKMLKSSKR
tara:strand:+ start:296 stop:904 length:609 start_codon:yes stop_codon:yes gene_type:complete